MQSPVSPRIRYASWALYLVGTAIVFGSYLHLVPAGVGWIGWLVAMSGWVVISFFGRRKA